MGLFDRFKASNKQSDEVEINAEQDQNFILGAEKAADIVTSGIENGDISGVSSKLNQIYFDNKDKERFVFNYPNIVHWIIGITCLTVFSVLFIYIFFIGIRTAILSESLRTDSLFYCVVVGAIILLNFIIIQKGVQEILFAGRYYHYENILKYKHIEIIDDLATMINRDTAIVERDLKKAVRSKLIPQGHFGKDNVIFIVSDSVYEKYSVHRAIYDRYFKNFIEERNRMRMRTKETEEILAQGNEYVQKIQDCNVIIKDKEISAKLDRMERVVSAIFHEVDINPAQSSKLGVFMGYYLPTTEKLLESYIEIDERNVKGKSSEKSQKDISYALDSINDAFESLLERFYEELELDVASDISAMETIMKQEGLVNDVAL